MSEAEIQGPRQAFCWMPVQVHLGEPIHDALAKLLPKRSQALALGIHLLLAYFASLAEADDQRHRQGAAAQAATMTAAVEYRFQPNMRISPPNIESTHALGAINFVSGQAENIQAQRLYIDWNLAGRLSGVGVKKNLPFFADGGNLTNGLQSPDFIVGSHDADEDCLRGHRLGHLLCRHAPKPVDGQDGHIEAFTL